MAEERLIDDDKDKKYKIRKNADGEDELYIDDTEEETVQEEVNFLVPEAEEDDEEAAVMTPEQLAARERAKAEAEEKRLKAVRENRAHAEEAYANEDFDGAFYYAEQAIGLDGEDGSLYCLALKAVTRNFTDFSRAEECSVGAKGVLRFADDADKTALAEEACGLKERKAQLETEAENLAVENEAKKSERRVLFTEKRRKAIIFTAAAVVPCVIFAVLAVYFASVMFAELDYTNQILTFVFAGLAAVAFIVSIFALKALWKTCRNVKLNEKNSSTKLGREYEKKRAEIRLINETEEAFKVAV